MEKRWRSLGPLLPNLPSNNQPGPEGLEPQCVQLVMQTVLSMFTNSLASLVLLPTEQLYSLSKTEGTGMLRN